MDIGSFIQSILPGLLAGGGAAGTSFLTVFKNALKKLGDLEKKIGEEDSEPPTGIYYTLDTLKRSVRDLKNEIYSWRDDPPDWLIRIVQRSSRSSINGEALFELEQTISNLRTKVQRLEESLSDCVPRSEYELDSKERAAVIRRIQENLRSANSFLKGVLAALGYIDTTSSDIPVEAEPEPIPPVLPRQTPRIIVPTGKPFSVPRKKEG